MLTSLLISLLVSSAVTLRRDKSILFSSIVLNAVTLIRDKSILFSRIVLTDLLFASFLALNNLFIKTLENLNLVAYVNTSSFSKNRNLPNSKGHVNPSNIIISSASYSTYYGVSTLHYFKSYFSLYFFSLTIMLFNLFIILFSGDILVITALFILLLNLIVLWYLIIIDMNIKNNYPRTYNILLLIFLIISIILFTYILWFLFDFYYSVLVKCISLLKKYFSCFKRSTSYTSSNNNNNNNNNNPNNFNNNPSENNRVNKKKRKKHYSDGDWEEHMHTQTNARKLDREYYKLLEKICYKNNIPAELMLEIRSYIEGNVKKAYLNRLTASKELYLVQKVGDALWFQKKDLMSDEEFLAWRYRPHYEGNYDLARQTHEFHRGLEEIDRRLRNERAEFLFNRMTEPRLIVERLIDLTIEPSVEE